MLVQQVEIDATRRLIFIDAPTDIDDVPAYDIDVITVVGTCTIVTLDMPAGLRTHIQRAIDTWRTVGAIDVRIAVGAVVKMRWFGTEEIVTNYVSFGQYDEDKDMDSFGVPDDEIVYYCFGGEDELKAMIGSTDHSFEIYDYEVVYR